MGNVQLMVFSQRRFPVEGFLAALDLPPLLALALSLALALGLDVFAFLVSGPEPLPEELTLDLRLFASDLGPGLELLWVLPSTGELGRVLSALCRIFCL